MPGPNVYSQPLPCGGERRSYLISSISIGSIDLIKSAHFDPLFFFSLRLIPHYSSLLGQLVINELGAPTTEFNI